MDRVFGGMMRGILADGNRKASVQGDGKSPDGVGAAGLALGENRYCFSKSGSFINL